MFRPRWRKVLHDLWDSKLRTVLVVLSISVGVFAVGMIAGAYEIISNDLPITYAAAHFPGSRSKIHGWINRYPQIYLYMEANPKKDAIPPSPIGDLEVTVGPTPTSAILDWTAPWDNAGK